MGYTFSLVLLIGIIFNGDCTEFDPLFVSSIDGKFHIVQPAEKVDEGYVFNYFSLSSDSHLYYACPYEEDVLKLTEVDRGMVKSSDYKCSSKVKTTSILILKNESPITRHQIGFKVFQGSEEKTADERESSRKMQKINSKKHRKVQSTKIPEDPKKFKFLGLITVTFDNGTASTLSVYYPYLFPHGIRQSKRTIVKEVLFDPDEKVFFNQRTIDFDALYDMSKEKANSKLYLVKCQLAPADDFLLDTWKELTYHDLNTAPMYNIFVDKWQSIEDEVRQRLYLLENAHIGVGTALFPENTEPKYMDMDDQQVRIPDLFFKVVANINEELVQGIIIIMHNNPNVEREPICEDTCIENNWNGILNEDSSTGRAYCCDVNKENLQKLGIPLTGDFGENMQLNPLNMKEVMVVAKYLQFPIRAKVDFTRYIETMSQVEVN